jgi:hypothetical protein
MNYATGGLVPGWNVYVKPHLPQYWRSWWKDIYRVGESIVGFWLEGNCTYKDPGPAGRSWALATKTLDLAIRFHFVILENGHLDLLALMLYLFGSLHTKRRSVHEGVARRGNTYVVCLFLALLRPTTQAEDEVKGGFLLNVVIVQCASIFKLLPSEDQTLLIRRNAKGSQ